MKIYLNAVLMLIHFCFAITTPRISAKDIFIEEGIKQSWRVVDGELVKIQRNYTVSKASKIPSQNQKLYELV